MGKSRLARLLRDAGSATTTRCRYSSFDFDDIQRIEGSCAQDDAERYVQLIDAAIHYANTKFQGEALPKLVAQKNRPHGAVDPVKKRQAALDHLAKKLAKPER